MNKTNAPLLGAHMSVAGGYHKAILRGESIGCTTIQIFSKSNQTWYSKKISHEEAELFKKTHKESSLSPLIMVHSSYLINLATPNKENFKKSVDALLEELQRCELLGIPYLILHPGTHTGAGEEEGCKNVARGIDEAFERFTGSTMLLLETMAGQGTSIGHTFENLKTMHHLSRHKKKVGICLDTCHVFAAGYDISTFEGYEAMWQKFEATLGLDLLKSIHLNNSLGEAGCKKDRHAKVLQGKLPLEIFGYIMNDQRLRNIPKVLETPITHSIEEYKEEIELLKKLIVEV